jgi:Cdc6-like AAA superfamily ATPase
MLTAFTWKRFWCPRGENIDLSDHGFLSDPDSKWGKYANPDLVTFEHLAEMSCVALLGEPGIGKSWTLRFHSRAVEASLKGDEKLVYLDLRSFGNEQRLLEALFGSDARVPHASRLRVGVCILPSQSTRSVDKNWEQRDQKPHT